MSVAKAVSVANNYYDDHGWGSNYDSVTTGVSVRMKRVTTAL